MQLTFEPTRLTGLALLAVAGVTALSVGACSSSNNAKSPATSSPATSSPAASDGNGPQPVHGMIASVSGSTVQVTEKDGAAAVDFSPTTKVNEITPAQFTNVANGNCVTVVSTAPAAGGPVTAKAVNIVPAAANGKCAEPKPPANPAPNQPLRGTVASVAGDTITVSGTDVNGNPSQTPVKVDDKTRYSIVGAVDSGAIAQGKCITAAGKTKDEKGALQATAITLSAANNGKC
jgi:hypothetical protein